MLTASCETLAVHRRAIEQPIEKAIETQWVDVCAIDDILPGTGVAVLVNDEQISIIRYCDGCSVYAISNFDPFSKSFVLARGIVGDKAGSPKIASPIYKQGFNLETGQCFDDPNTWLPVYPVRVVSGRVLVGVGDRERT